jgi:eukaryotic-like serine/threonine-protein kinase
MPNAQCPMPNLQTPLPMNIIPRTVVNQGKYVLRAKIGKGVFSVTYRGVKTESGETVIIKTLSDTIFKNKDLKATSTNLLTTIPKFIACQHPHLVKIIDYFDEEGRPYIVLEHVTGKNLAELISAENPLPVKLAIDYIRQLASATLTLHQHGLLHEDIRPHNIIKVRGTESLILGELGIVTSLHPKLQQTHAKLQAAGYAPIERYQPSQKTTPASDIYSLAATLYFLLTGTHPVPAPVREEYSRIQPPHPQGSLGDPLLLPALRKTQPKIKSAIELAIWRGLEIDAEKRPQSIKAWLAILPRLAYSSSGQLRLDNLTVERSNTEKVALFPSRTSIAADPIVQPLREREEPEIQQAIAPPPSIPDKPAISPIQNQVSEPPAQLTANSEPRSTMKMRSPWMGLLLTFSICLSTGMGFGLALRQHRPTEPGETILHTEQSFPNRSPWPIQETPATR